VRLFVAVELPRSPGGSERAPAHLTLRFLGEVGEGILPALRTELARAVASVPAFSFRVEGVGAFPSPARPRVVWRGVTEGRAALERLAAEVRAAVAAAGVPEEPTPFTPHVTLFRVRSRRDARRAAELLGGHSPPLDPVEVAVDEVLLRSSVLGPAGAVHATVASFPLGPAGGPG
jgi:RNA 2',3'-cyclic 3'-phosphodiesterase